jgi:hypothetical protein
MKRYDCPVKRYPGYVIMPDYLTWEQMAQWDDNLSRARDETNRSRMIAYQLQGVIGAVAEWHLQGLPDHPTELPATPVIPSLQLANWIIGIVNGMINEAEEPDPFLSVESGNTSETQN